ncbi:hypothetical protein [Ancylobacter sp. IITR112]
MRREPHIYRANRFSLAFIIAVAALHIINSLSHDTNWTVGHVHSCALG